MSTRAFRFLAAAVVLALTAAACEKSNDVILQEQFEAAQEGCPRGCLVPPPNCTIKGNVSGAGLKFFLVPGTERYPLAIIEADKGEAWFCTEAEAMANGFQPVPPELQ